MVLQTELARVHRAQAIGSFFLLLHLLRLRLQGGACGLWIFIFCAPVFGNRGQNFTSDG